MSMRKIELRPPKFRIFTDDEWHHLGDFFKGLDGVWYFDSDNSYIDLSSAELRAIADLMDEHSKVKT